MVRAQGAYAHERWGKPASDVRFDSGAQALCRIDQADCGLVIWRRPVDTIVQEQAAVLAEGERVDLRLTLPPAQLAQDALTPLTAQCRALGSMTHLLEDIQRLTECFAGIASRLDPQHAINLRLETLHDDGCRRFHVDRVQLRLLCTYLGPGTEWLAEEQVDRDALAGHLPNESIVRWGGPQRLEPFWVAILRGDRYPGAAGRGQVHRSPPIGAAGIRRVLLCLDV